MNPMTLPPLPYQSHRKKDGHFIYYRTWPVDAPRATVMLVHGMGGYSGRFPELATRLNEQGFHVEAPDLQGFGASDERKGHIPHFACYRKDLALFAEKIKTDFPEQKLFIIAESMGALATLDLLTQRDPKAPEQIAGVTLISPALKDALPIPFKERALIGLYAFFNPSATFPVRFSANRFTRDEAVAARIDADPLEVRRISAKLFYETLKAMIRVNLRAKQLTTPVLIQQAGTDHLISSTASEAFYQRIGSTDKLFILYKGFFHALYLDKGREQVFKDMVSWLSKHCS